MSGDWRPELASLSSLAPIGNPANAHCRTGKTIAVSPEILNRISRHESPVSVLGSQAAIAGRHPPNSRVYSGLLPITAKNWQ
jgi:hypothetical protein